MISFFRSQRLSALFWLGAGSILTGGLHADGILEGYVRDTRGGVSLEGAEITLPSGRSAIANRRGYFRLTDVPAGEQTIRITYLGSDMESRTVSIADGETTSLQLEMTPSDGFELEALEVRAAPSASARALNLQKTSENYRNIVASDYFGRFPDGNAAEALARLPGISVERDQGEGRFVIIRGIDPNLNSVSIDGLALASPSADERKTLLDTIPTEVMERIEVTKAVLPSQPGDSIGGHIEISTPSAFDRDTRILRFSAGTIYTDLTEDFGYEGTIAYGERFGADRTIGLHLTINTSERSFGSDNQEADEWEEEASPDDGNDYFAQTSAMEFREYDLTRERLGLAANLEFKPNSNAFYYVRGSYNDYTDVEQRQLGAFAFDYEEEVEDDQGNVIDVIETEIVALSETSQTSENVEVAKEYKDREEAMRVVAVSAGGENRFDRYTLDYKVGYSYAEEDTPYDFETVYELDGTTDLRIDRSNRYNPIVAYQGGADFTDASAYEFDELVHSTQLVEEDDLTVLANLRGDYDTTTLRYFKTGFLYRQKTKESNLEEFVSDDNPSDVDTLDLFEKTGGRDPFGAGFPLQAPRIREFYQANTADFTMERDEEASLVEDYEIDEDVLAAYFMANFTFDQFEIIAGARVEHTEMDSSGVTYGIEEINDDDVITITRNDFSKDYTNWMPGVHFKYTVSENLITRASWTNTIARPTFGQNFPGLLNDNGEVEAGNPDLDPYEASNFDLSVEYYAESLGLFSAAVFYKDVENFIYEQTSEPNTGGIDELTTFRNGPSGEIYGLELAFQRQIDFIPGLGVYAAATFTDGEADVLAEDEGDPTRALPFVKQSDFIGQLALTYERGGYFVRLAATQRSEYLDEVGGEEIEDRYVDSHFQLDLSTAYYVNDRLTLNATLNNLTNEPFRASWGGGSGRLSQFEEYGWWATLGLEWKL